MRYSFILFPGGWVRVCAVGNKAISSSGGATSRGRAAGADERLCRATDTERDACPGPGDNTSHMQRYTNKEKIM